MSSPAFSFSGDTNLGIYRIATDTVGFATTGSRRMSIDSVGTVNLGAGSNGSLNFDLEGGVSTIDATVTTILTITTPNDRKYTVEGWVIGSGVQAGTTYSVGGKILGVFQNVAGTLNVVGIPGLSSFENFPTGTPTFSLSTSGTQIRLRVQGVAATNIQWWGKLVYIYQENVA